MNVDFFSFISLFVIDDNRDDTHTSHIHPAILFVYHLVVISLCSTSPLSPNHLSPNYLSPPASSLVTVIMMMRMRKRDDD